MQAVFLRLRKAAAFTTRKTAKRWKGWLYAARARRYKRVMTIHPELLELLVCPLTKSALRYDESANELISDEAKLAYPVRVGIPIMLPEEARSLEAKD